MKSHLGIAFCLILATIAVITTATSYNLVKLTLSISDDAMADWDSVAAAAQQKFGACFAVSGDSNRMRVDQTSNNVLLAAAQTIPAPDGCARVDYEATITAGELPGVDSVVSLSTSPSPMPSECVDNAELLCALGCAPCPMGSHCEVNGDCVTGNCSKRADQDAATCQSNAITSSSLTLAFVLLFVAVLF